MFRIDAHPTRIISGYKIRPGKPLPFGASLVPGGVNFSVFSRFATACSVALFEKRKKTPSAVIPLPDEFRIGNVFSITIFDLDIEMFEYAFMMDGPSDKTQGHWFDKNKYLLDPYAKLISGREHWGDAPDCFDNAPQNPFRGRVVFDDFDWGDDKPLEIPLADLIIYETHVRGFTKHSSSAIKHGGTFFAMRKKIPYLKELGINCVELLPVYEYDEFENSRMSADGTRLLNYWGYSTVGFFAPKAGLAASGIYGMQVDEFKSLVKAFHKEGIEVMLDVVFNHTAEGNENGPYISFRGVDNKTYYMLTPEGYYYNFSGCGNTLNCNNPLVRNMILGCLRYWASEYHIDGFRFDLAAILGRAQDGSPMQNPPLLESLAFDPILGKCKLVAEAWDAGGLYQVGSFSSWGRWVEWNGKFRDDMRKFLKGDANMLGAVVNRLQGSPDLYNRDSRGSCASINFITCHDGFTLKDLVSYNYKHNEANGENNNDGSNDNESWNCGEEGETNDENILRLRVKQMKNAACMLLLSRGVPMILSGDEFANTQFGNNNSYCQDNEISWLDWSFLERHSGLYNFFKALIAFRKVHYSVRSRYEHDFETHAKNGYPNISLHGKRAWNVDYSADKRAIAVMYGHDDELIYFAMNMHWETEWFELPKLPDGCFWSVAFNTDMPEPLDVHEPGKEPICQNQDEFIVGGHSCVVLIASTK